MSPMDRFMSKVAKTPGCWIWMGTRNVRTGRAYFKANNRNVIAARWLWQQLHGQITDRSVVMHRCDNPSCVNPEHLDLGTQLANIADRDAKGRNRLRATHCANGHELTQENVRLFGSEGRWRKCLACARAATSRYRAKLEAENY